MKSNNKITNPTEMGSVLVTIVLVFGGYKMYTYNTELAVLILVILLLFILILYVYVKYLNYKKHTAIKEIHTLHQMADTSSVSDEFELFIAAMMKKLGYQNVTVVGRKGVADGGMDITATLKGQRIIVQCKRWNPQYGKIEVQVVRELYGVAHSFNPPTHCIIATTAILTKPAEEFCRKNGIEYWTKNTLPVLINRAFPPKTFFERLVSCF